MRMKGLVTDGYLVRSSATDVPAMGNDAPWYVDGLGGSPEGRRFHPNTLMVAAYGPGDADCTGEDRKKLTHWA